MAHDIARYGAHAPPVVLVCGGKDVGKSSLVRYLINTFLNMYVNYLVTFFFFSSPLVFDDYGKMNTNSCLALFLRLQLPPSGSY